LRLRNRSQRPGGTRKEAMTFADGNVLS
jgi:hypothetical protein